MSICHADMTVKASECSLMHVIGSCTLTQSMCWPAYKIPLGLSSLLSSLPPHLLLCSSHSFLPPPLREEKICHSLGSYCRMMDNSVMGIHFLTVTKTTILWWPRPWRVWDKRWERRKSAVPYMKLETSWWCCLRMFWRCGGGWTSASLIVCSLPLSHFLSFFTWLRSEPTASTFEIQDTFPALIFSPPLCPGEFVCSNYMGTHQDREEEFALLNWAEPLPQSPKEPWKGIGAFPDTFGMALFLLSADLSSLRCALCCLCWHVLEATEVLLCNCSLCVCYALMVCFVFFSTFRERVKIWKFVIFESSIGNEKKLTSIITDKYFSCTLCLEPCFGFANS